VVSSEIDDAYLMPVYTKVKPIYTMYGLSLRSRSEELRRYFFCMELYGLRVNALERIVALTQKDMEAYYQYAAEIKPAPYPANLADAAVLLKLVVYYAYSNDFDKIFVDAIQRRAFEDYLRGLAAEAKNVNYSYDYAVVRTDMQFPALFAEGETLYKNSKFTLIKLR
jgi:hypothetical protein